MVSLKFLLAFGVILLTISSTVAKLPSSIKVCHRDEPSMSNCIIDAIKVIQPRLASGDFGDGFKVPGLEPFVVKYLEIGDGDNLRAKVTNLKIKGASNFTIDKLRANVNDLKFDVLFTLPKMDIKGNYDLSIRLLGTPIKSQGEIFLKLENFRGRVSMKASKYTKNGEEFIRFGRMNIKIIRGKTRYMKLTNLFNGNKSLEEAISAALTSNSDYMLSFVYPSLEKNLGEHFALVANEICGQATLNEMFPL